MADEAGESPKSFQFLISVCYLRYLLLWMCTFEYVKPSWEGHKKRAQPRQPGRTFVIKIEARYVLTVTRVYSP